MCVCAFVRTCVCVPPMGSGSGGFMSRGAGFRDFANPCAWTKGEHLGVLLPDDDTKLPVLHRHGAPIPMSQAEVWLPRCAFCVVPGGWSKGRKWSTAFCESTLQPLPRKMASRSSTWDIRTGPGSLCALRRLRSLRRSKVFGNPSLGLGLGRDSKQGFIWEFQNIRGTLFWGPYNRDPII